MQKSNPLACTSRFSVVVAELLISLHSPETKNPFLSIFTGFPRISGNITEKAGIPLSSLRDGAGLTQQQ